MYDLLLAFIEHLYIYFVVLCGRRLDFCQCLQKLSSRSRLYMTVESVLYTVHAFVLHILRS